MILLYSHLLLACLVLVSAHSIAPKPLRTVAHLSTHTLEVLPRRPTPGSPIPKRALPPNSLRHDDTFRLVLSAFGSKFHLHLRPNEHLIHPAARINHYHTSPDGRNVLSHTTPLLRESVLAYEGEVIPESLSKDRLRYDAAGALPHRGQGELGWARIIVHHQGDSDRRIAPVYEGAFSVNGVVHHVMTKDRYLRTKHPLDPHVVQPLDDVDASLVIWRDSDVMAEHEETKGTHHASSSFLATHGHCGHDELPYNSEHIPMRRPSMSPWYDPLGWSNSSLTRRQSDIPGMDGMNTNYVDSIGKTDGCPKSQRVLYMGVAADCRYVAQYGGGESATNQILNNWNTASALYRDTFNVSLGIVELAIQSQACPSQADPAVPWNIDCGSVAINDRLGLFSQWRGRKGEDGVGLWHLMSGCPTGTEVGIAWLATTCMMTSSGSGANTVSGTGVSTAGRVEWQVVAHEIGHNFGAIHDCTSGCSGSTQCCPLSANSCDAGGGFLMNPTASQGEDHFSPCSIGNICAAMGGGKEGPKAETSCFVDPGSNTRQIISLKQCGNGIVEDGEDCDPGQGTNSTCCDPQTCKFKNGAQCDPDSSPCCTSQCTFAPSTQVCRESKDSRCDTPEMCSGTSSKCPDDKFAPNGQSCGDNGLQCASGMCTSIAQQCQTVGAPLGLKEACPSRDDSCQISCQDPKRANACIILQSILVDGSPCGYGGTCLSGNCQKGNFIDTAKAWYTSNLQIAIPVTIVGGIIALMILFFLLRSIYRCLSGRSTSRQLSSQTMAQHQRLLSHSYQDPTRVPLTHPRNAEWVDDRAYNGYTGQYPGRY